MVSFDVKSLFTNVPLKYTIDLVLERIYDNGELSRSEMKEMLTLCPKNVHFTFNGDIYLETDCLWSCYGFPFRFSSCWNIYGTLGMISSSRSERPT